MNLDQYGKMSDEDKLILKNELLKASRRFVSERIGGMETAMKAAQESGNDETKSTTGDKHETGKAMMQLEQEKIGIQLHELQKMNKVLDGIPLELSKSKIKPGNVIVTDNGNFYISVAAGKISVDDKIYFAISAVSPLGILFLKSAAGQTVNVNEKLYKVIDSF
ncbi:MAG TPA: 3-oxoacyl-ACP synthase [Bacteroidia bacterium]|nr:3-oxoacyl-ACP synthase [Bacteroidia bacterium]